MMKLLIGIFSRKFYYKTLPRSSLTASNCITLHSLAMFFATMPNGWLNKTVMLYD